MSPYVEKQIVKHALQYYITRPDADPKDIHREKTVLNRVEEDLDRFCERNHIDREKKERLDRDYVLISKKWSKVTLMFWGRYTKDDSKRSFGGYTDDINICERYTLEEVTEKPGEFLPFDIKDFYSRKNADATYYAKLEELVEHFRKPATVFLK